MDLLTPQSSDTLARMALTAAPNGVVIVDQMGRIFFANREIERLFGYTQEQLIGKKIEILLPDEIQQSHPQLRTQYMACPVPRAMGEGRDLRAKKSDGTLFPVEVGLMPLQHDGRYYIVSSIIDLTQRTEQQRALQSLNARLKQKSREMEQLVYTVSHDLKAPIVTLAGNLGFLMEDIARGDLSDANPILQSMERALGRMKVLIGDVLEISRLGVIPLQLSDVDLDALLDETLREVDFQIVQAKATIVRTHALGSARVDRQRVKQVLENLLLNALKYGASPNGVQIEILKREEPQGGWALGIRDYGPGISPEYQWTIFELFSQLDPSKGGTGVGLSIVKMIAELHGGKATVESQPGQGATFWISFQSLPQTPGDQP